MSVYNLLASITGMTLITKCSYLGDGREDVEEILEAVGFYSGYPISYD